MLAAGSLDQNWQLNGGGAKSIGRERSIKNEPALDAEHHASRIKRFADRALNRLDGDSRVNCRRVAHHRLVWIQSWRSAKLRSVGIGAQRLGLAWVVHRGSLDFSLAFPDCSWESLGP